MTKLGRCHLGEKYPQWWYVTQKLHLALAVVLVLSVSKSLCLQFQQGDDVKRRKKCLRRDSLFIPLPHPKWERQRMTYITVSSFSLDLFFCKVCVVTSAPLLKGVVGIRIWFGVAFAGIDCDSLFESLSRMLVRISNWKMISVCLCKRFDTIWHD